MVDIKTNIEKIMDELNFYMRKYPNTYSEVRSLLFEIQEQEQEIRSKAIDEFVKAINEHTTIVGTTYMCDIVLIAERLKGGA